VRAVARRSDASSRIHRLVGFDHATTGSRRDDHVGRVGALASGLSHRHSRLMKERRLRRYGNDHALRVEVQRLVRHFVVAVAIETTVVVVVVIIIVILMLIKLLLVMMRVGHLGVDR